MGLEGHPKRLDGPKCGSGGETRRMHAGARHCECRVWRYAIDTTTGERIGFCRTCYAAHGVIQSGKNFLLVPPEQRSALKRPE